MKDILPFTVQALVARKKAEGLSSKSVKNLVALLSEMWIYAKANSYTMIDPFAAVRLPDPDLVNEPSLSLNQMKAIIDSASEPMRTFYWLLSETGVRAGEICGLPVSNILLDLGAVKITQKVWHGQVETVKSVAGVRMCEISPELTEHLRQFIRDWRPNNLGLLFATKNGTPLDQDVIRKRKLYPLLKTLGIKRCGFHGFRHGNATVMDIEQVPMATRISRLGHSDAKTTMRYSHVVSDDGRKIAARFGQLLTSSQPPAAVMPAGNA